MSKKYRMDKVQNKIVEVSDETTLLTTPVEVAPEIVEAVEVDKAEAQVQVDTAIAGAMDDLSPRCVQDNKVEGVYRGKALKVFRSKEAWTYTVEGKVVAQWSLVDARWLVTPGQVKV